MSIRRGHDVGQVSLQALNGRHKSGGVRISRYAECRDDEDFRALLDERPKRRFNCSRAHGVDRHKRIGAQTVRHCGPESCAGIANHQGNAGGGLDPNPNPDSDSKRRASDSYVIELDQVAERLAE